MFSSISGEMNLPVDVRAPNISPRGSKLGWQPWRVVLHLCKEQMSFCGFSEMLLDGRVKTQCSVLSPLGDGVNIHLLHAVSTWGRGGRE